MAHLLHRHYHQLVLLEQGKLLVTGSETFKQTLQYLFKDINSTGKGTLLANTHLTQLPRLGTKAYSHPDLFIWRYFYLF